MAWTNPLTWVSQNLTAALLNTHLRDNLNETAPGIATATGRLIVTDGANSIAERIPARDSVAATEGTTSTAYTDLATAGPAVTATCGTSALVVISAGLWNPAVNGIAHMGCAVSGASTVAADDNDALVIDKSAASTIAPRASHVILYTNLTAGSHTFTAKYRTNNAVDTANFKQRALIVVPF